MFAWYNENATTTPNLSQEDLLIITQMYAGKSTEFWPKECRFPLRFPRLG